LKTYRATRDLGQKYKEGKYREGTQRKLVAAALLASAIPRTLESLFEELNTSIYWATLKHKGRNGEPAMDSWLMQNAGGIRCSVKYHLDALEKSGLVEVGQSGQS
jgi:hypothetical protein